MEHQLMSLFRPKANCQCARVPQVSTAHVQSTVITCVLYVIYILVFDCDRCS